MHKILAGLAVLPVLVIAGCSSSSGSASDGAAHGVAQGAPARSAAQAGAGYAPADGGSGSSGAAGGNSGGSDRAALLADTQSLIRTAEMRVRVHVGVSVAGQADRAEDITQAAGGQVFGDDRSTTGHGSATLTLKIPPEQLAITLTSLAKLGTEVERQLATQDVTSQVADVSSRVNSAREAIVRLRTLYGSATKVADVIAIEDELSTREADLESLEAQQRALSAQTSLATVHLTLFGATPAATPVPTKPKAGHGVGAAFARGWHAFATAVGWIVRAFATALPFVVVTLLAAAGAIVALRRRTSPPVPPAEPAT